MNYQIRSMVQADTAAVIKIIKAHDSFDGERSQWYFDEYFEDDIRVRSETEENYVAVDEKSGTVMGVCGFGPDKYKTPEMYWLNWFYVDEQFRRDGLGTKLYEHALSRLRRQKCRKLYLDTSSDPIYEAALAFYKRNGFREEGRLTDYYDEGEDFLIYGLEL